MTTIPCIMARDFVMDCLRGVSPLAAYREYETKARGMSLWYDLFDWLGLRADDALVDSGLAGRLQRAFGRDTGVVVKVVRGPASALLEALERGEHEARRGTEGCGPNASVRAGSLRASRPGIGTLLLRTASRRVRFSRRLE